MIVGFKNNRATQSKQPAPKEPKKKKTLEEVASSMLDNVIEKAREERMRPLRDRWKQQEDEVAEQTFGPNWRHPERTKSKESGILPDDDDDGDDDKAAE